MLLIAHVIVRPHHSTKMNFLDSIIEMIFVAIHSLILMLAIDDTLQEFENEVRETIGWVIIGCCLAALIIEIGMLVGE